MPESISDTLALNLSAQRYAVNAGEKKLEVVRTLSNLTAFTIVEVTLAANAVDVNPVPPGFGTIQALIVYTPKAVGMKINGQAAVNAGSVYANLDTSISALLLDNPNSVTVKVEIWMARAT